MQDDDLNSKVETLLEEFENLAQVKIPRCIQLEQEEVLSLTFHTFVDASQDAYGAVVHSKFVYQSRKQPYSLLASSTSISGFELTAAILGDRLTASVINVLNLKPD